MIKISKKVRLIAIIVASVIALSTISFFVIRCSIKGKDDGDKVRGTHERTVAETDTDLIKDGKTDYVIVTAKDENDEAVIFAVDELRQNFFEATGVYLEREVDENVTYTASTKVLSVGETSLLKTAGVTYDKTELGHDGYVVQTKGNSVFMVGGSGEGTLYAVYGWLKEQFEYAYFAIDEVFIQKGLTNEKLLNVSLKEKPDFYYRMSNNGEAWFNTAVARRARFNPPGNLWIEFEGTVNGETSSPAYHTSFNIVSPDLYLEDHPNWYSSDKTQLCLSRDPEGLAKVVVERIKKELAENPNTNILTFTQQDHNTWCTCDKCTESLNKYGTNSAVYILFMNRIANEIIPWVEATYPGREVLLAMFAYQQSEEAPVKKKGNKYVPMDESLRLHDNVALFYCPIYAEYYYDFNAEQNINVAETLNKWGVLAKNIFTWIYGANFQLYLAPYNNFNSMQNNYRFLYDRGAKYIFDQHQYNQIAGTDWYRLKAYLSSNLQWQIDQNQEELIDKFFTNYFKDAGSSMKKLFDEEQTWFAYLASEQGYTGKVSYVESTLLLQEYWPRGILERWIGIIDEAYKKIEHYKDSNPALYETLKDRITLESLTFRFMQIEIYGLLYASQLTQLKNSFINDCTELGIRQYKEGIGFADGGAISSYLSTL